MKLNELTENVQIHQTLPDEPNAEGGLTAAELKAKFDEAAQIIKTYINTQVVPAVNSKQNAEELEERLIQLQNLLNEAQVLLESTTAAAEAAVQAAQESAAAAASAAATFVIDPTLTAEGSAADAKATGEALRQAKEQANRVAAESVKVYSGTKVPDDSLGKDGDLYILYEE